MKGELHVSCKIMFCLFFKDGLVSLKVGMNLISNRFYYLNGKIEMDWLNLSYNTYKVKCKNYFSENKRLCGNLIFTYRAWEIVMTKAHYLVPGIQVFKVIIK